MNDKKQTRHNYEYDFSLDSNTAGAKVLEMVGQGKRVLEIGAGPGSITKYLVEPGKCQVTALERDPEAIKKLALYSQQIYEVDLNDKHWPELLGQDEKFEVVIAADVLEHLYDPWTTLKLMKGLIDNNGYLVVSLPHTGHNAIIACLLNEDFEYRDWGLLDRTHIRFFGLKNMQSMFEGAGLIIEHAEFIVVRPDETEFSEKWNRLPGHVRNALSENRFGSVYQVVIKARPDTGGVNKIDLLSLPVELPASKPVSKSVSTLRRIVAKYLPESIKVPLKRLLRIG